MVSQRRKWPSANVIALSVLRATPSCGSFLLKVSLSFRSQRIVMVESRFGMRKKLMLPVPGRICCQTHVFIKGVRKKGLPQTRSKQMKFNSAFTIKVLCGYFLYGSHKSTMTSWKLRKSSLRLLVALANLNFKKRNYLQLQKRWFNHQL